MGLEEMKESEQFASRRLFDPSAQPIQGPAAVDFLGLWGYIRGGQNPAYGDTVIPFVFLARLNALAVIPFIAFFSVLSVGGDVGQTVQQTGDTVELQSRVDPDILGGLVVQVGNMVLDTSIRNRLEKLRKSVAQAA